MVFFGTLVWALKEPILLPVQILWINLLTDGLPALALGADPARKGIMENPPIKRSEPIINKQLAWLIGSIGLKKTIILGITFFITLSLGFEIARTTLFTGFILYEFVRIGSIRYRERLTWFSNKYLLAALVGSIVLHLGLLYSPLGSYFGVAPLGIFSWSVLITGVVVGYILAIVITKIIVKYVKD